MHCSQCCESSKETPSLSLGLHRKSKSIGATAQHRHAAGWQSPPPSLVQWDPKAQLQDFPPKINIYIPPVALQDCTVQMRENQTMTTNIKAATAKNQHWFHISSINTKAWIFSPHRSTIPSCEASKKLMESPYRDLSLLFRSLTVEKKRGEFLYNK